MSPWLVTMSAHKSVTHGTREGVADDYSTYDQSVEIVGCWHSWFSDIDEAAFDHFPTITINGRECTPDFLVSFAKGYCLIGELCRLSMNDDGLKDSVLQALGYADFASQTDVMMLVPHDYADQAERRMLDAGLLHADAEDEPLVVLSYVRVDADRVTRWVFKRPSPIRAFSFRDAFLGARSLHEKMTVTLEGLKVPPKFWRNMKIRYPFCNDAPPPLYTACVLWEKVFSAMLSDADYVNARVKRLPHIRLTVTPTSVREALREQLDIEVKVAWLRDALELLARARLAEQPKKSADDFVIKYGKITVPGSGHSETHELILDRLFGATSSGGNAVPQVEQDQLFPDPPALN